jgi:hypothetical protein
MAVFRPPTAATAQTNLDDPDSGFMKYVKAANGFQRGKNVFIHNDNSVDGDQGLWSNVKTVFYGGHATVLTGEQITLLTNAGYGANITPT